MTRQLIHEYTLIAYRDDTGKPAIDLGTFRVGLAGAAVADLLLGEHAAVVDGRLRAQGAPVADGGVLAGVLASIAAETKPRTAQWWVSKLSASRLRDDVLEELVAGGSLSAEAGRILGLFPTKRYPAADGRTEAAARIRVESALRGGEVDATTAALIGVCDATRLLERTFGPVDRERVKSIVSGDAASPAVRAVIATNNALIATIVTAAVVTPTIVASS